MTTTGSGVRQPISIPHGQLMSYGIFLYIDMLKSIETQYCGDCFACMVV